MVDLYYRISQQMKEKKAHPSTDFVQILTVNYKYHRHLIYWVQKIIWSPTTSLSTFFAVWNIVFIVYTLAKTWICISVLKHEVIHNISRCGPTDIYLSIWCNVPKIFPYLRSMCIVIINLKEQANILELRLEGPWPYTIFCFTLKHFG